MRRARVLAVAFALLTPCFAIAGDSKAESDKLFADGLHLFEQHDYINARQKFADAYAKYPSPNSLLNLARSEQLSSRCIDAIAHYRAYVALPPNPRVSTGDRGSAQIKLTECLGKIGRVQVDAPRGARVTIDGLAATWTPGESLDVTPGEHRIDITVEGLTKSRTTTPSEGQVASVQWEDPKPPEPPPVLVVTPPPPVIETKPPEPPPPPPVVVETKPPETKPQNWKQESHWPSGKVASAIALGIAGIGSFITAPSLLAASLGAANGADAITAKLASSTACNAPTAANAADCMTLTNDRNLQGTYNATSALFFVLGVLFAGGSIAVMVAWPNIHPLVTTSANGFSIRF